MSYVIGIDVGGTFTDAVLDDGAGTLVKPDGCAKP